MITPANPPRAPRIVTDAACVLANAAAFQDRPHLLRLARLVLATVDGRTLPQRTIRPRARPVLRAIRGDRA